ncbi:MAG: sigma-70 family RNA polymerase sigma factor [Colwellia polaris]|jgi:RNA polymerase sigma-70 factor (ECF subfamily)|uniref:sigma-70 family RNA polymerase sigma factor n=1 Tax=Colwellia polaris TaxID=326537 RepID=UPI000A171DB8|nr:sigma-70 family RNA polymerase sigma factor [Colwellia polaris]|tara:strand:+ start:19950 stop:20480 length:531 start_codon:yes stop_codon:yes gene_type:complete
MENEQHLALLGAIAQGDKKAFSELYQSTSQQLYAVSLKMLTRKELAEEALQEAYVRIWHNASEYRQGKGSVLTWMISIVRYRALDVLRYNKVRKESEFDESNNFDIETIEQVSDAEQLLLDKCLQQLDTQQRQAIYLAYFNGCSHKEVVKHLNNPLGTIKSWIRRGLMSLQSCLTS